MIMISGATEEELIIANDRADLLLKIRELENINDKLSIALNSAENKTDQLTNNWNELEECIKQRIQYWEEQEKEWIKQGFMKFGGEANNKIILQGLLDKMKEIKEGKQ